MYFPLFCILFLLGSATSGTAVIKPVLLYDFLYKSCTRKSFPDKTNNLLIGNLTSTTVQCPNSNGVLEGSKLVSQSSVNKLQKVLSNNDFSIEIWIRPNFNNSLRIPILSVDSSVVSCPGNLQIYQEIFNETASSTEFIVTGCNKNTATTNTLTTGPVRVQIINGEASIVHLFVQLHFVKILYAGIPTIGMQCNFTINGINIRKAPTYLSPEGVGFAASTWSSSAYLRIFRDATATAITSVQGTNNVTASYSVLYYLAFYNQTLSSVAIKTLYNRKLPFSPPFARNFTVAMKENGENGNHANNPWYYQHAVPTSELPIINLPIYDLDNDPISPNYNASKGKQIRVFITKLGSAGQTVQLYDLSNKALSSLQLPVLIPSTGNVFQFKYRPPSNQYSLNATHYLTKLSYIGYDNLGKAYGTAGTVSVYVERVYKPPLPTVGLSQDTLSRTFITLQLSGSADSGRVIAGFYLYSLPLWGRLYAVDTGIMLQAKTIYTGTLTFKYFYTGPESLSATYNSLIRTDSFQFGVVDDTNRISINTTYGLTIYSSINIGGIQQQRQFSAIQGKPIAIQLYGKDVSSLNRALYAEVLDVPSHGILTSAATSTNAYSSNSVTLAHTFPGKNDSLVVYYQSTGSYFTTPNRTWNGTALYFRQDEFTFRMTTKSNVTSISPAQSLPMFTSVNIVNVNEATGIAFHSAQPIQVTPLPGTSTSTATSAVVALSGFTITDPDHGVDLIKVHINTTTGGILTLNPRSYRFLDFNSITHCGSGIKTIADDDDGVPSNKMECLGDTTGTNMIFVTAPDCLALALNGMTYENTGGKSILDTIAITIYDGQKGDCLTKSQNLATGSIHKTCFVTSLHIAVQISGITDISTSTSDSNSTSQLTMQLQYVALALAVLLLLILIRYCWCKKPKQEDNNKTQKETKDKDDPEQQRTFLSPTSGPPMSPATVYSSTKKKQDSSNGLHSRHQKSSGGNKTGGTVHHIPLVVNHHRRRAGEEAAEDEEEPTTTTITVIVNSPENFGGEDSHYVHQLRPAARATPACSTSQSPSRRKKKDNSSSTPISSPSPSRNRKQSQASPLPTPSAEKPKSSKKELASTPNTPKELRTPNSTEKKKMKSSTSNKKDNPLTSPSPSTSKKRNSSKLQSPLRGRQLFASPATPGTSQRHGNNNNNDGGEDDGGSREDWTVHRHPSGRLYYYNHKTKKSTWKTPACFS